MACLKVVKAFMEKKLLLFQTKMKSRFMKAFIIALHEVLVVMKE